MVYLIRPARFCISHELCYQHLAERRVLTDIGPLRLSLVPTLPLLSRSARMVARSQDMRQGDRA